MKSKSIIEIFDQINSNDTYKKIFINGAWGIGKSYYANEYINNNKENFAYISLFGKSNFESIENELAKQLMKKLNFINKGARALKQFYEKINGSFSYKGFSIKAPELTRKGLISEYSSLLDSKSLIIVIDDLERKSGNILIEDIMGMIEEFSQFEKVKLIIIGDESNMESNDKLKWEKFKEKIIEKEYRIINYSDDAITNLVTNNIKDYIENDEIEKFINNYIKKHNVNNLRTIIKGINLFKEIINNFILIKDNKKVNLMLLKNCMSVAIECTEQLYKPDEKNKEKNPFQYAIDEDIKSRIIHHYFNSIYVNNRDTYVLHYVLDIFNCNYSDVIIEDFNSAIDSYLNLKCDEKNIFYLSEKDISKKVEELIKNMNNNEYIFTSLDKFIDDFYDICVWNDALDLKYKFDDISATFNKILFEKYYDVKKYIYQNKIDTYEIKRRESDSFANLIDNYNKNVDIKFIDDKLKAIEDTYNKNEFDEDLLHWLDSRLVQSDKEKVIEQFIALCRKNNYFIPDVSGEISDKLWGWIHKVWAIFSQRMTQEYKSELNIYAEKLKINNISSYRINALQEYRPLVQSNN